MITVKISWKKHDIKEVLFEGNKRHAFWFRVIHPSVFETSPSDPPQILYGEENSSTRQEYENEVLRRENKLKSRFGEILRQNISNDISTFPIKELPIKNDNDPKEYKWLISLLNNCFAKKTGQIQELRFKVQEGSIDYDSLSFVLDIISGAAALSGLLDDNIELLTLMLEDYLPYTFEEVFGLNDHRTIVRDQLAFEVFPSANLGERFATIPNQEDQTQATEIVDNREEELVTQQIPAVDSNYPRTAQLPIGSIQMINDFSNATPHLLRREGEGTIEKIPTSTHPRSKPPIPDSGNSKIPVANFVRGVTGPNFIPFLMTILLLAFVIWQQIEQKREYSQMQKDLLTNYQNLLELQQSREVLSTTPE